ncbi:MAG: dihydroneopterin aldolase [Armatimonadetes bacterium]|nr:dihydroneopterin aldolase [Armatimonadota bacterium]MDE2206942.1 dihydroneopterin aldolase [Armatimonadota bacterium]
MDARSDAILIQGLEFYGYHGASDEEQEVGHRFVIDVVLEVDLSVAGKSDALADTVSYARVARRLVEVGTHDKYRLVEALAEGLCQMVLLEFPGVNALELCVRKSYPPVNMIVSSVGVRIYRSR